MGSHCFVHERRSLVAGVVVAVNGAVDDEMDSPWDYATVRPSGHTVVAAVVKDIALDGGFGEDGQQVVEVVVDTDGDWGCLAVAVAAAAVMVEEVAVDVAAADLVGMNSDVDAEVPA